MGVFEDVKREYPMLAFLFKDPQVGKLLRQAVDPNIGFSPQEFQAKLYGTTWFRQRSQAHREYSILANVDPGELKRRVNQSSNILRATLSKLGANASSAEIKWMANYAVREGVDPSNAALMGLQKWLLKPRKLQEGAVLTEFRNARALSSREYFVGSSQSWGKKWGVALALGLRTQDDLRRTLSLRAQSAYPHLKNELQRGATMAELFDGHRQIISEELELDPEAVTLYRGQWNKILRYRDPTLKRDRALTLSETRTLARQDPRFWNTSNGKAMGSGLSKVLLETFGKRAA